MRFLRGCLTLLDFRTIALFAATMAVLIVGYFMYSSIHLVDNLGAEDVRKGKRIQQLLEENKTTTRLLERQQVQNATDTTNMMRRIRILDQQNAELRRSEQQLRDALRRCGCAASAERPGNEPPKIPSHSDGPLIQAMPAPLWGVDNWLVLSQQKQRAGRGINGLAR